jgi:DNA repair protein RadD
MPLRYYQKEAKKAVFDYWSETPGNPLVVAATGTGKSIMQASLTCDLLDGWSDLRVMNATHVVELVEGNYKELLGLRPFAPTGIFASSLGQSDYRSQVLFAQLQTVHNKAKRIGHVDVLQIDEAHLVPFKQATMYRRLIDDLMNINPDMKINGFTATDYRLDGGRLTEGDGKLFDEVVYDYGIRRGIDDGYLTPITSKPLSTKYDMTGVGRSMGEYKAGDYRAAVDTDELNRRVAQEVLDVEGHRKTALIFCRGIEHAARIRDSFKAAGRAVELVHGGTPGGERRRLIEDLKAGLLWGLVNDNILSTGTNIIGVDLIVDLYRTMSAGRYVQRVGRMTRVIYPPGFDPEAVGAEERRAAIASWLKPNGRYMDFAGNINEHGPVDMVQPKKPGDGKGEAPIKICPNCEEICHASVRVCSCCGFQFEFDEKPKYEAKASDAPIISTQSNWREVTGRTFREHPPSKPGLPPTVKTTYRLGLSVVNSWICPQHGEHPDPRKGRYAKGQADRYWRDHGGKSPFPKTVFEFLDRASELKITAEIETRPNKNNPKYTDVIGWRAGTAAQAAVPTASNDNWKPLMAAGDDWDQDIPF